MKIGVDAMGGDYAPLHVVLGAIQALDSLASDSTIVLFGNERKIREICHPRQIDALRMEIVSTAQVIEMGEHPVKAFQQKKDSSLVAGFLALQQGAIDAFAGAGNTGAMLVGAQSILKTVKGLTRPCISAVFPVQTGGSALLLDVGLNADCRPDNLFEFGLLGSVYARNIMGIKNPRVALLNIGEEPDKGNMLTRETYELMDGNPSFHFVGNIESSHLFSGTIADVIVTDGFAGNIVIKQAEAMFQLLKDFGFGNAFFDRFDYEVYGGTPILGINAPVVIGHGASSPRAIAHMILKSEATYKAGLVQKIKEAISNE
ncbi:MAG: phosphate acyltransferase [Bacteroidales bacterium]|nr:phosphate acyltransferase [Bacteroidales bacterium]MCL2738401.1 phosphate acyltransferase [Bacteroidales bacterium]